jgi:predicted GH43/DUF377 family glycosyl hydrolase
MKKLFILFTIFGLIVSCTTEIISPPSVNSGKLQLKIDKQNAPESVVYVKAYLTRENFNPISGTLNLLSDSTADILLNEIDAGSWHLKVDAEDDSGLVLYTGETDVQVFAGFTSQVYLTLEPTGSGTGSIYINVTWGVPTNLNWIDYHHNPLISSSGSYYDNIAVAQPVVLFDDGIYKIWYHGLGRIGSDPWKVYVLYSESIDGINWTKFPNPVMYPGYNSSWDSKAVSPGAVIKENGIYKMYYCGYSDEYDNWHVGYATSVDGINWEKYPQPIITGTYGWEHQLVVSSVVKKDNLYYLYYTGRNLPEYKIGVATSSDGINWTKYPGNPILINDKPWEMNGILEASVVISAGTLKMVYMNSGSSGFGTATSVDGLNWVKSQDNPFFTNANTSNGWAAVKISYPYMLQVPNELRIYYNGYNYYNSEHKIGLVKKSIN